MFSFRRPGYEGLGLNQGSLVVGSGSGSGPLHLYFPGGPQLSFGFKATTQKVFNLDSFKVAPRKNIERKRTERSNTKNKWVTIDLIRVAFQSLVFKRLPRLRDKPGIFWFSLIFSHTSSALDHSVTAPSFESLFLV